MSCIFCRIVKKEVPCFKLFEDDLVMSFLDVNPTSEGHLLVVSKEHFANIYDTPDNVLERINITCKKMALLLKEKLKVDNVNILNASGKAAQQSVYHLHFHVVPRKKDDGLDLWFHGDKTLNDSLEKTHKRLIK